jgi:methionine synthase II (cobalamin-independent)
VRIRLATRFVMARRPVVFRPKNRSALRGYDLAMFATLLGGLPRPITGSARDADLTHDADLEAAIQVVVRAQEAAGLEPITDGRLRTPNLLDLAAGLDGIQVELAEEAELDDVAGSARPTQAATTLTAVRLPIRTMPLTVDAWRSTAALTERAVKQALPGPYTLGRRLDADQGVGREEVTLAIADAIRAEVEALAAAGCPLVEIEELDAHRIGDDESERHLFREAHRRLAESLTGTHLSLSIIGGSADGAGAATILEAPYDSLAVDLIAGPDNWRIVAVAPNDRGIVAGALSVTGSGDEGPEVLLYAAHYAASTAGRGLVRVGLGTAGGLAHLSWPVAERKLQTLGNAARLAAMSPSEQLAESLDPRAVSPRRAALGHGVPPPPLPRRRTRRP